MVLRLLLATNVKGPPIAVCGIVLGLDEPQPANAVAISSEEIVNRNLDFMGDLLDGQRRFEGAGLNSARGAAIIRPKAVYAGGSNIKAVLLFSPPSEAGFSMCWRPGRRCWRLVAVLLGLQTLALPLCPLIN